MTPEALVLTTEADPAAGGVQAWGQAVAACLAHAGRSVEVVPSRGPGAGVATAWGWWRASWAGPSTTVVVMACEHLRRLPILCLRAAGGRGPRLVVILHGQDVLRLSPRDVRRLQRLQTAGARVVANSRATAALYQQVAGRPVTAVIPPFIPVPAARPRSAATGPWRLLSIGRLVERKNFHGALEAVALLRAEGWDLRYDLIGDGPWRDRLAAQVEALGLAEVVTLHGALPEAAKQQYLSNADTLVMPSLALPGTVEGYGIAAIEANALGVPVVAGDTGGMPEAVLDGQTGVICSGTPSALAAALRRLRALPIDPAVLRAHAERHDLGRQTAFVDLCTP